MKAYLSLLACLAVAAPVWAVKTAHWVHTTEADFRQGNFSRVVATNLGDLKLSREVKTLLGQDARVSAVYSLAQAADGTIYAGTGPEGILLAIKDEKISTAAQIGQYTNLYSLLVDAEGRLLVGTGGEKGRILRINKPGEKPEELFAHDDVQYVWAMTQASDGTIYAATGPNGQLFEIDADGAHKLLLDTEENNLLCLLSDGRENLFIGSDPNGLVFRVDRKTGAMFVVYDAAESEVGALVRDGDGNLYAATSESTESGAGETEGAAEQVGRPESEQRGVPIPSNPPAAPEPPEVPGPAPGEPIPIPKAMVMQMSMAILAADEDSPEESALGDADAATDGPTTGETKATPGSGRPRAALPAPDRSPAAGGNAIYRIDPEGFVTEVFRQPASVFAMIQHDGALLAATGADGNLYQVSPATEETLVLAKVDPKDILCLLPAKDGRVYMGLANAGEIAVMATGFAGDGTYTSPVLDATQISRFGKAQLRGMLPEGASIHLATRSGNVEEASAPGWSDWSKAISAAEFVQIASPAARFLQYRLTFSSNGGKATPIIEEVDIAYQVPNLAPQIRSVKVEVAGDDPQAIASSIGGHPEDEESSASPTGKATITWEATDPNEDRLEYALYFRSSARSPWILMKEKLKDPAYEWQTRNVGDGRYQIKVEASDTAANPKGQGKTSSRVSDPVVVDNTAPAIGDIKTDVAADGASVSLKAADRTSTLAKVEYAVDSATDWQTVLPSDKIADSPEETYQLTVGGLSAGAHQITVRATDAKGNRAYESVSVTIDKN